MGATREYQFDVGVETETLPAPAAPTGDNDTLTKGYGDKNYCQGRASVADVTALKAVAAADRTDGMACMVRNKAAFYRFDAASSDTGDDDLVVTPTAGTGRWLKVVSSSIPQYGLVPVGGIIAIAANLTGAYSIPASGAVSAAGWMRCDAAAIPGGQTLSGNTPQLTDNRFLMGVTTTIGAGVTGGAAVFQLTDDHMPDHVHTMNHGHSHNITTAGAGSHRHAPSTSGFSFIDTNNASKTYALPSAGSNTYPAEDVSDYTDTVADHTHTINGGVSSVTANTGPYGESSPTSLPTVPPYLSTIYLIRVI